MARSPQWDTWVAKAKAVDISDVVRCRPDLKLKRCKGGYVGPCPTCGGEDRFSVASTTRKKVFRCRGCGAKGDVIAFQMFLDGCDFDRAVEMLSGEPKPPPPERKRGNSKIIAEYPYTDEAGKLLFQVVRFRAAKDVRLARPDGNGGWRKGTKGVDTSIIYRAR